jgi:hypothetical protein
VSVDHAYGGGEMLNFSWVSAAFTFSHYKNHTESEENASLGTTLCISSEDKEIK